MRCIVPLIGKVLIKCNNGVFVHIFPLDGYEDNIHCRVFHLLSHIKKTVSIWTYNISSAKDHIIKRKLMYLARLLIMPRGIQHCWKKLNEKCTEISTKYKDKIGNQYTHFDKACWTWDAHVFDEAIYVPFEYTTVPIPKGYHEMLTVTYGDYMKFPPVEKRVNKHSLEYEPDVPYKEYCHQQYGVKYN